MFPLPAPSGPKRYVSFHQCPSVCPLTDVFHARGSQRYSPMGTGPTSHAGAAQSPSPVGKPGTWHAADSYAGQTES
jgi:hypothetical protein